MLRHPIRSALLFWQRSLAAKRGSLLHLAAPVDVTVGATGRHTSHSLNLHGHPTVDRLSHWGGARCTIEWSIENSTVYWTKVHNPGLSLKTVGKSSNNASSCRDCMLSRCINFSKITLQLVTLATGSSPTSHGTKSVCMFCPGNKRPKTSACIGANA